MVEGQRINNLGAELSAGSFKILAGVSEKLGGRNEGPSPHELLEASLAACTIITLHMYASRKQMKLENTKVTVKVETESKASSLISRKIDLVGDLTGEEKTRLLEIANKCPIHNLLSSQITIQTELI